MKRIISLILVALFLFACALESEFALPNTDKIDSELIGVWTAKDGSGKLIISENENHHTFQIKLIDEKKVEELVSSHSFNIKIKGYNIINISDTDSKNKTINTFYSYRISENKLFYREVSDSFTDKKFASAEELLSYFKNNINKQGFFNDWVAEMIKTE